MALLMEKIVRPYVPIDTGPATTTSKCQQPVANTVIKLEAPPSMNDYAEALLQKGGFKVKDPPKTQEKTKNSSWSYSFKKYMTKKEKEVSEEGKEKDGVVTDKEAKGPDKAPEGGKGGEGGGTPQGSPNPG